MFYSSEFCYYWGFRVLMYLKLIFGNDFKDDKLLYYLSFCLDSIII